MKALIWKEYRERRIWVLMLAASAAMAMFRGGGYTFVSAGGVGDFLGTGVMPQMVTFPIMVALACGAGAFSSEIDRSARFLFSQPVTWKKLALAKLIVGLAVLLAAAVLSALIFRVVCPPQYAPFATIHRLSLGVLIAFLLTAIPFLAGFACSVVLPGGAGGLLVLVLIAVAAVVENMGFRALDKLDIVRLYPVMAVWLVAPVAAMLITLRKGLDRPLQRRSFIYGTTIAIFAASGIVLGALHVPADRAVVRALKMSDSDEFYRMSVGPDGRYAILDYADKRFFIGPGGRKASFPIQYRGLPFAFHWPEPDAVIFSPGDYHSGKLVVARLGARGGLITSDLEIGPDLSDPCMLIPSPNGKRFAVVRVNPRYVRYSEIPGDQRMIPNSAGASAGLETRAIGVADCTNSCSFSSVAASPGNVWWQSEDELGYTPFRGGTRFVKIQSNGKIAEANRAP